MIFKLLLKVQDSFLNFTAHDYQEKDNHFSFTDKFGKKYEYNKACLVEKIEVYGGNVGGLK